MIRAIAAFISMHSLAIAENWALLSTRSSTDGKIVIYSAAPASEDFSMKFKSLKSILFSRSWTNHGQLMDTEEPVKSCFSPQSISKHLKIQSHRFSKMRPKTQSLCRRDLLLRGARCCALGKILLKRPKFLCIGGKIRGKTVGNSIATQFHNYFKKRADEPSELPSNSKDQPKNGQLKSGMISKIAAKEIEKNSKNRFLKSSGAEVERNRMHSKKAVKSDAQAERAKGQPSYQRPKVDAFKKPLKQPFPILDGHLGDDECSDG